MINNKSIILPVIFGAVIFLSAFLLFVVQPMVGAMILPLLGGSSSVWTTVMLFFQSALLAGYFYAHGLAKKLSIKSQVIMHSLLVVAACFMLPLGISQSLITSITNPVLAVLIGLFAGIGVPVLVVTSSAPLLQHWFSNIEHPDSDDPYYLYSASNAGSVLALLAYPFIIERYTVLTTQAHLWAILFGILTIGIGICGVLLYNNQAKIKNRGENANFTVPNWYQYGQWTLFAFVPSTLMLGVTHYITTDLAAIPLLWVIPLALYMGTFIVAFAQLNLPLKLIGWAIPILAIATFTLEYVYYFNSITSTVLGHTILFGIIALYYHGRLAQKRPSTDYLTQYYIIIAFGGALGGVANSIVAPQIFYWLVEYPLGVAIAIAFVPVIWVNRFSVWHWLSTASYGFVIFYYGLRTNIINYTYLSSFNLLFWLLLVSCVYIIFSFYRPSYRNVTIACIFAAIAIYSGASDGIYHTRSFFGQYRITETKQGDDMFVRTLFHGTTSHGKQLYDSGAVNLPLSYYHPKGPLGDVFGSVYYDQVAIGGLGTGAIASYANSSDTFTFYEIDPTIKRIANNKFHYLDECSGHCQIEIGDARQKLKKEGANRFDIIVMDAYSSDAIPTHLLTKEALRLYMEKIRPGGAVVLHLSNRYLDLTGVVGTIVDQSDYSGLVRNYTDTNDTLFGSSSTYIVLSRSQNVLERFKEKGWSKIPENGILWTDNYTNLFSVLS